MATLNAKKRNALSDDQFAFVDKDGVGHLPINDAAHTRAAMARFDQTDFPDAATKAKARSKILAAAKKFGIDVSKFTANPIKSVFDNLMDKLSGNAEMSVESQGDLVQMSEPDDAGLVVRKGKIFQVGSYPDKSFDFSESDLEHAVSSFAPVPVDLEHTPTVLEGKLGHVQRIYAGDDGATLMGEVHLPAWLDSLLTDGERKVSATWDRATKQLKGLALVRSPRVSDAALMAAFAKHNTPAGQSVIQMMHDVAASGGAVCNKPAAMHARHELNAIQSMHDTSVEHGATCQSVQPGQSMPTAMYAQTPTTRSKKMPKNLKEYIFGKAAEDGVDLDEAEFDAAFARDDNKVSELEAKLAAQEAANDALRTAQEQHNATFARMEAESRASAAAAFAKDQVIAGRISPAAQAPLAALTTRILAADATATFAEGEKSNTVLLKEVLDALESDFKVFTKNTVGDDAGPFAALFAEQKTKGVGDPEVRDDVVARMLKATPQGRAHAKEKQNGNNA